MEQKNNVWELLEFIEISTKGLQYAALLQSQDENNYNDVILATAFVKKEIYHCICRNFNSNAPCTLFGKAVNYDLEILHDYYGDNLDTVISFKTKEGEKYDIDLKESEEPHHYECYMDMIKQNQVNKYKNDQYPYIHFPQHQQTIDFILDRNIYQNLFKNAVRQLKEDNDPILLQEFEHKINLLYEACHNIKLKPQYSYAIKTWRKELLYNLQNFKNKCKKLNANGKDLKIFLYFITLITQQSGIDLSKGTIFSHYLASILNLNKETIDDYLKRINQNDLSSFWNNYELQINRLLETDSMLCNLSMDAPVLHIMRKKIAKVLPPSTEQVLKEGHDKAKLKQYRELKELSIKKALTQKR